MRKIGKRVGSKVYIHRDYVDQLPTEAHAVILNAALIADEEIYGYDCIRYDKKTEAVAFQFSPDFDTADEPIVGKSVLVKRSGAITITPQKKDAQIWHHKWMWVADDY